MKKSWVILAAVAGLLCSFATVQAQTKVRAEGMAIVINNRADIARDKALDAALRSAVEKVAGVMVSSTSEVENFQLKMDRILSESKGFVNTYKIVSESRQQDRLTVVIDADVGEARLKDRLSAIQLIVARKSKPRLMLWFAEKAQKDAIAEAAMSRYFIGKGFKVIDGQSLRKERSGELPLDPKSASRLAGQFGAEVVLIGGVETAANAFNVGGIEMHRNQVTVSLKVINGDTGEVITTDSKAGSAPGMKGDIKKITEEAAEKLARQTLEEVLEKWSAELVNTMTVKLLVSGLDSYEDLLKFKDLLSAEVKGFKELHQRAYQKGHAELDLELRGNCQTLADDVAAMTLNKKKVKILGITANKVEVGLLP
ncbi:MAG: flagellar assembly protein T N-terminal domain-containing protein [Deltaproteobacteria bacterium]|nr:flagellar assembly protein T N-terminal domain-containing protein [Deltaproteobacteria bacterium]